MVLLSGEAGIGKSRLTAALLERLAIEPHTRLRHFCSPQHTDRALYPIISQMETDVGAEGQGNRSRFPIVYMTGGQSEAWKSQSVPKSILLEKPFAPAQLLTAIAQLLKSVGRPADCGAGGCQSSVSAVITTTKPAAVPLVMPRRSRRKPSTAE